DVTQAHDILSEKLLPAAPVSPPGNIHQNDRNKMGFARLCQRDRFQELIMSAEAARKDYHRVSFFDEYEFAREEKMKVHELGIVTDNGVRILHRRKTNIDAEPLLSARPFMSGLHDSRSSARDHHQPCFRQLLGDAPRQMIIWVSFFDPGRTEDTDLAHMPVGRKNAEGATEFL